MDVNEDAGCLKPAVAGPPSRACSLLQEGGDVVLTYRSSAVAKRWTGSESSRIPCRSEHARDGRQRRRGLFEARGGRASIASRLAPAGGRRCRVDVSFQRGGKALDWLSIITHPL